MKEPIITAVSVSVIDSDQILFVQEGKVDQMEDDLLFCPDIMRTIMKDSKEKELYPLPVLQEILMPS